MNIYDINKELVAPCGMNCRICSAYLAYSRKIPKEKGKISHCIGCRPRNKQCAFIKKRCEIIKNEYFPDKLRVTDLLYELENDQWIQKVTSYFKTRISRDSVLDLLKETGFKIKLDLLTNGIIIIIGQK